MADFGRGIKAGIVTGIIYMVISVILGAIYQNNPLSVPHFIRGTGLTPLLSLMALTDPSFVISLLIQYVVRGIVFGAVFAALYNFLPGTASIVKGVALSLFLWIVAVIQVIYTTPGWPWTNNGILTRVTFYGGTLSMSSVGLALGGIISALVFGALTGFLWDRFRAKELTEERKVSPVLLVSFILGGVTWIVLAVTFLIAVVIRGAPAIQPGSFWWTDLLYTSVVFLGLPGWVLALVAWRRTRRGESGLKLGVAGGVIMALTGIMLLPGALAIIGGVFNRRRPANESGIAETAQ
jgi:hypothetical protein